MKRHTHRPSTPEGATALTPRAGQWPPGPTLQIVAGIVGAGSLFICLWQLAQDIHRRRAEVFSHLSYTAPSLGPGSRQHRCRPSHWHCAYDYRRLEVRSTLVGRYCVVRHRLNRRYYVLGRITDLPGNLECFEDIFGLFEDGRLAYYVFLTGQGVDGYPSPAAARRFIAAQRAAPLPPFPFTRAGGSPFYSSHPSLGAEQAEGGEERPCVC
jgi:hypothetical protein